MGRMQVGALAGAMVFAGTIFFTSKFDSNIEDEENLGIYMHGIRQSCPTLSGWFSFFLFLSISQGCTDARKMLTRPRPRPRP